MASIRALLIDELGFDPDEPVTAAARAKSIAQSAAPTALAGAMPAAPELRVLRDRIVALRRSKFGAALGNVAEVASLLGVECVAPAHQNGEAVAVVRTASGRVFVLPDRCPHDGGTISDGFVEGEHVVCARHGWEIEACSGRCPRAATAEGSGPIAAPASAARHGASAATDS